MTLEEALVKITSLEGEITTQKVSIAELSKNAGKLSDEDQKKIEQKAYNQGFDKAKNQFEGEKKDLLKKEDVEKLLSERDHLFKIKTDLREMGVKNADRAMKMIDEDDLKSFGTDEFKTDDFKTKYGDVLIFAKDGSNPPKVITKDNKLPDQKKVTSDSYGDLSPTEKAKMSPDEKLALLRE
ncbi:MAG: hypothetical protein DRG09_06905 [Epsilonproteobacteria bacterium]|nr:MAG: hypothetical protein DRG09_06905 [Campylobacterota bacterium]